MQACCGMSVGTPFCNVTVDSSAVWMGTNLRECGGGGMRRRWYSRLAGLASRRPCSSAAGGGRLGGAASSLAPGARLRLRPPIGSKESGHVPEERCVRRPQEEAPPLRRDTGQMWSTLCARIMAAAASSGTGRAPALRGGAAVRHRQVSAPRGPGAVGLAGSLQLRSYAAAAPCLPCGGWIRTPSCIPPLLSAPAGPALPLPQQAHVPRLMPPVYYSRSVRKMQEWTLEGNGWAHLLDSSWPMVPARTTATRAPAAEAARPSAIPVHSALESGTGGGAGASFSAHGLSCQASSCPSAVQASSAQVPGSQAQPVTAPDPQRAMATAPPAPSPGGSHIGWVEATACMMPARVPTGRHAL